MSDDRGGIDMNKKDASGESAGDDDTETVVSGTATGEVPEEFDPAATDAARTNYATFAAALAETADADETEAAGDTDAPDEPDAPDEIGAADEIDASDDTVYSGLEEVTEVVAVPVADAEADFEGSEVSEGAEASEAKPKRGWRRDIWQRQISVKPIPVILVLLVLISGGAATWLYFRYYQPDEQTSQRVARAAITAASEGTVSVLSYSADSLDKDFATARSHLSGDFLSYYDQFTQQYVAPAAKQKSLKTTARVVRAAVQELRPTSATVLVFVDQSTTSKDAPEPSMAARSVLVNLALVDGKWLITKFNPV